LEFILVRHVPSHAGSILSYWADVAHSLLVNRYDAKITSVVLSIRDDTRHGTTLARLGSSIEKLHEMLTANNLPETYVPPRVDILLKNTYLQINYIFDKLSIANNVV
jgi:hypothetical protein